MKEVMDRVVIDPEVLVGKPVIKGTRIPIYLILEFLGCGLTEKEVLKEYPTIKGRRHQSGASLRFKMHGKNEDPVTLKKPL